MKDFKLNRYNIGAFVKSLFEMVVDDKSFRVNIVAWRDKRSLSQNALFHVWVKQLSEYLVSKGRTDSTKEFSKRLLKHTFLGYEDVKMTDAKTGITTTVSLLKRTSNLDSGEMNYFMNECYAWCVSIGLLLTIPEYSEYKRLNDSQEN